MKQVSLRLNAAKKYALAHKSISTIAVLVLLGGGYYTVNALTATPAQARYLVGTVSSSTIISTVSASGQIAASNQINVTAQATGQLTWVGIKAGDHVSAGQALASIDDTNAKQAVTQAQQTLAADELQYQKDSAQAPITYQNDQATLATNQQNLTDEYNTIYNDLSQTYLDLPNVMTVAQDTLYGYDLDSTKSNWNMDYLVNLFTNQQNAGSATTFKDKAVSDYDAALASYNQSVSDFTSVSRTSDTAVLEQTLSNTASMATAVAQAMQSELNFLGTVSDLAQQFNLKLPSAFSTLQSTARTNLSTANTDLTTLINDQKTLTQDKQAVTTAQSNVSLDQVGDQSTGSNPISLQIEANNLEKDKTSLANAEQALANYTVVAPFSGTVASVPVQRGDGSSGTIATIITDQQVATISLNEVDAAKIQLGDKATLTFDAISGLTLTGTVAEIDPTGTVSQGVVSYNIQITLDTQDNRIKPGMTVNAVIQSAVHQNALVVPQTAVKTLNGNSFVLVFNPPVSAAEMAAGGTSGIASAVAPQQVPVVTGISDNTNIEILSGLTEGEQIVLKTVTAAASGTSAKVTSGPGGTGGAFRGGGGFGGAVRIGG